MTATMIKEVMDSSSNDEESFGRRQRQRWRWKMQMTTSWAKEASDVSIGGRGSSNPLPRRWKELHTKAVVAKGTVHGSSTFVLVHRRQRMCQSCTSTTDIAAEKATMRRGNSCTRSRSVDQGLDPTEIQLLLVSSLPQRAFLALGRVPPSSLQEHRGGFPPLKVSPCGSFFQLAHQIVPPLLVESTQLHARHVHCRAPHERLKQFASEFALATHLRLLGAKVRLAPSCSFHHGASPW
ncbi:hypothetical protein B296_00007582 [Ensete ventricosum]|uniref:Uncharacterized protein n=1 Tax=Ensete ventricosum TaxID=4639 RepID=A0A427BBE6_ENSVE|nr:hypothetical protein B296_00007582 [Ensete ventricosum]